MAGASWINQSTGHLRLTNNGNYKWWVGNNCYWYCKNISHNEVKVDGTNTDQSSYDLTGLNDGIYHYDIQVYEEPGQWVRQAEGYLIKDYGDPTASGGINSTYKKTWDGYTDDNPLYCQLTYDGSVGDNAGLEGFHIYLQRASSDSGPWTSIYGIYGTNTWPGVDLSRARSEAITAWPGYYYRVQAYGYDWVGRSKTHNSTVVRYPSTVSAPGSLTRSAVASGTATMTWTAPTNGEERDRYKYQLYKVNANQTETLVSQGWLDANATSHALTGLLDNTEYRYTLRGENKAGLGSIASRYFWAWDTMAPQQPSSISSYFDFDRATKDSVDITYDNLPASLADPGGWGFEGFYLSVVPQGSARSYVKLPTTTGVHTATGLSYGTIYEIALQSRDNNGNASPPITALYYHTREMTKRHSNDYDPFKRGYPRATKRPDRNG